MAVVDQKPARRRRAASPRTVHQDAAGPREPATETVAAAELDAPDAELTAEPAAVPMAGQTEAVAELDAPDAEPAAEPPAELAAEPQAPDPETADA
jgi:hypothetical protein